MSIRVLVADDDAAFRDAVHSFLGLQEDMQVVGVATDGREVADLYRSARPDVVLMDVGMPNMDGIAATRWITESDSSARVVMLSVHNDPDTRSRSAQAGAVDFVAKDRATTDLCPAVRRACEYEEPEPPIRTRG